MTQLGEPVQIGAVSANDLECPFDHASPEKPPIGENKFVGVGKTLGDRMASSTSTIIDQARRGNGSPAQILNPNNDPAHALHRNQLPVKIKFYDEESKSLEVHGYRVTCAAHHLIPAQASLKRARTLLNFMVAKRKPEPVKGKPGPAKGMVVTDLGYDVNGSENGIFLPGNYAVTRHRGKLWVKERSVLDDAWDEADPEDDDEDDVEVKEPQDPSSPKLTGMLHQIDPRNR